MAVTFGSNALSEATIDGLFAYAQETKSKFAWGSNFFIWPSGLTVTNGAVITHALPTAMTDAIFTELVAGGALPYLPRERLAMFYSWFPGSNIAWHRDYPDKNSMTVYLSRDWVADYGGHFCWREWDADFVKDAGETPPDECRMRMPKFNDYLFMTDGEWHATTITSPYAPARLSLQTFFSKP